MSSKTLYDDFSSAACADRRALFLLSSFPFFIVGKVKNAGFTFVTVKSEIGVPQELKGLKFRIRFENINAFFIEDNENKIPDFK
jgi:hypothetical protein